jgi:hypothetical protein
MTADEIGMAHQRYRARVEAILTPDEMACYDSYQRRVEGRLADADAVPVAATPGEQAVLDKIAADIEAAALNKQLMVLLRVDHLPS